jgi:hypothetical protein
MSREHAVAERPAPASTARETRLPVREPSHDTPERGATTRDRLAAALVGEERAAETTRERVATAVRGEPTSTVGSGRPQATRRATSPTAPTVPTHPAPSHPKGRLTVDRPHGPARCRAPPRVFTKLHVTDPVDAWEAHADAVAALVLRDSTQHENQAPLGGTPVGPDAVTTEEAQAAVEEVLAGTGGVALPDAVRRRVEPVLHADLSRVQVRQDAATVAAARALGARAFTVGRTIHLGPGASTHDLGLMAHEATHVVHQGLAPARAPPVVMRSVSDYLPDVSVTDVIPDSVLDGVRTLVRAIPGYTALTYVVGQDLLTGEPVHVDVDALLDAVLTHGPFGPAVATVLRALSIAQDIYAAVTAAFTAHNLTLARFGRDIEAAWGELSITKGIDGNVAVVRRYIDAILADLRALVSDLVDQVLALVRRAVVAVAEPFLQRPSVAPVWNLAKEVLHYDPLRGVEVQVPTAQIIADFLTLIGQSERLEQMRQRGTLQETADWLDTQLATFRGILIEVGALFSEAWDAIQPTNLPNLLDTLPALADRAVGVVQRIADFGLTLIVKVLELVKKALLGWLSEHAHQVPGFHMLTVIIGQNPFTGDVVPRTPANLIKGFITLLPNGEATYDELEKSGVVTEAAGRIEAAMVRLGISLDMVVATFRGVWDTLSLDDLLQPIAAFQRVVAQFGQPLARIIEFVGVVLQVVVELILRLMNFPTELLQHVITNAMQAIEDIRRDPVGFLRNVMAALKLGFSNFFDHIGGYLLDGLVAWLFRGLGQLGIHLPTDFSLKSIIGLVLDVLGLSIEHLWDKLGEHIGQDKVALIRRAIDTIGGAWQFIADVQREGLPAIWRYVEGQLSNLWQMLLDAALSWITRIVVQQAVTKLLSFLDPTGIMAVINSAIAIFNAIQSAIEYLRDLLEVLDRYVSTLAAVAAGNVVPGAQMLEQGLAAIIPIAIGFLANQVGLGNIPEKIVEIVGGIRHLVDEALDWLIEQALRLGRAALDALGLGQGPAKPEPAADAGAGADRIDDPVDLQGTTHHLINDGPGGALVLHTVPTLVNTIPDPALQTLVAQYNAITLTPSNPAWSSKTKVKDAHDAKALEIAKWISTNAPPGTAPGGSAPGLGNIEKHNAQISALSQAGIPLWLLEAEHVVPFDVLRGLGDVMGTEGHAERRVLASEVGPLTTIAIYERAANWKTGKEIMRRKKLAEDFRNMSQRFHDRSDYEDPEPNRIMRAWVLRALAREATWYADLTWQGVQFEHAMPEGPPPKKRGDARAEATPVPALSAIKSAADQEIQDYTAIVDAALLETARP